MRHRQGEEWRDVPGWPGYHVSNLGGVASSRRGGGLIRLKQKVNPKGYHWVSLISPVDNKPHTMYVHRLVLLAFVGPPGEGQEACHADDDPSNNRPDNLSWGTHQKNVRDCVDRGHHHNARKTHCKRGHPYDEANTMGHQGRRRCRACHRMDTMNYRDRQKTLTNGVGR